MLRLLRRAGAGGPSSSRSVFSSAVDPYPNPPSSKGPVSIRLNIPAFGGVFMTSHQPSATDSTDPSSTTEQGQFVDRDLSGEIEIEVRQGAGQFRCRAIRATLHWYCRLYMGEKRGWEEDVLFERTVELKGALVLDEGIQRLSFTIHAPFSLPTWDTHKNGIVRSFMRATVVGLGPEDTRPKVLPTAGHDQGNYPDGIPAPFPMQVQTQMTVSWADPVGASTSRSSLDTFISSGTSGTSSASMLSQPTTAPIPWLKGSVASQRCITFLYNPHPTNGVNKLYERSISDVPGLGALDVRFMSQVWTVSAMMLVNIHFPQPSPKVVIYYARVMLAQIVTISSPRDPKGTKPTLTRQEFTVWEKGTKPPERRNGTQDHVALYRGTEAGGVDSGEVRFSGTGVLPNDEMARASTLEVVESPIRVRHELVAEVWHSVFGEDLNQDPLPKGGHGTLRLLRVDKPVILPSCAFIPEVLELPSYEWHKFDTKPCATCHTSPEEQACRTCPLSAVPHARHDFSLDMFTGSGICPECEKRFIPDDIKWNDCACGLRLHNLKERMMLEEEWERSQQECAGPGAAQGNSVKAKAVWEGRACAPASERLGQR